MSVVFYSCVLTIVSYVSRILQLCVDYFLKHQILGDLVPNF